MDTAALSLVSAATALAASVIGPCVTLMVAKRQFNANVISANRQAWIVTVRDTLAEMISLFVGIILVKRAWKGEWQEGKGAVETDPTLRAKLERSIYVQCRVRLLLNPTEPDHREIMQAIERTVARLRSDDRDEDGIQQEVTRITVLSQEILKREWRRVKSGV